MYGQIKVFIEGRKKYEVMRGGGRFQRNGDRMVACKEKEIQ